MVTLRYSGVWDTETEIESEYSIFLISRFGFPLNLLRSRDAWVNYATIDQAPLFTKRTDALSQISLSIEAAWLGINMTETL